MNTKLQEYFPNFEANQVLTNTHLNDLRNYLDEQTRLSRYKLSGIGVASGLTFDIQDYKFSAAKVVADAIKSLLILHNGFGISSEGYLIDFPGEKMGDIAEEIEKLVNAMNGLDAAVPPGKEKSCFSIYSHIRTYNDPSPDKYWFDGTPQESKQVPLELLLTQEELEVEIREGLSNEVAGGAKKSAAEETVQKTKKEFKGKFPVFKLNPDDFKGKVLVLYLEIQDRSLRSCVGNDCDNKGVKRYLKVRPLLIPKKKLSGGPTQAIIEDLHCDNVIQMVDEDDWVKTIKEPESLSVTRFIKGLGAPLNTIVKYDDIIKGYTNAMNGYPAELKAAIKEAKNIYGPFLGLTGYEMDKVENLLAGGTKPAASDTIEFCHDFLDDLSLAYNEFVSHAWELKRECCGCDYTFCKHLMLGETERGAEWNKTEYDHFRHYFRSTAISPDQDRRFKQAQMLWDRILLMVIGFEPKFRMVLKEIELKCLQTFLPTREDEYPLGKGTIPDYYNNVKELSKVWDPYLSIRKKSDHVLSFSPDQNANGRVQTEQPLDFSIDSYPGFKYRSFLGNRIEVVMPEVNECRIQKNLPHKVIPLLLAEEVPDEYLSDLCLYPGFQDDYLRLRAKVYCILSATREAIKRSNPDSLLKGIESYIEDFGIEMEDAATTIQDSLSMTNVVEFFFLRKKGPTPWQVFREACKRVEELLNLLRYAAEYNLSRIRYALCDCCVSARRNLRELEARCLRIISFIDAWFANCCYAELSAMADSIEARRKQVKAGHMGLFKNFVTKHVGAEHTNEVKKGGTLLLVHLGGKELVEGDIFVKGDEFVKGGELVKGDHFVKGDPFVKGDATESDDDAIVNLEIKGDVTESDDDAIVNLEKK
jgi:hypothetical protein